MAVYKKDCIFCNIIKGLAPCDKIYENDHVTCIKDIRPASTHHYLIIPKMHLPNAKDLKQENKEIFDKMVATVKVITEQQGLDPISTLTGFHWPPFTTVNHLHLHVISPTENMNFLSRIMFRPDSFWFVSTSYVESRFQSCN